MRRLLKAAPPGLDYKALIGVDPLADPLADPAAAGGAAAAAAAFAGNSSAPSSTSSAGSSGGGGGGAATRRTAAGLAAARARAMTELRSVAGLEHAPALSKLAARIPGVSVSAVHLAVAQRVLCGETGGLSLENEDLLRGACFSENEEIEDAEALSASVYHLLSPLLPKMAAEDLVEVAAAVCAPHAAGDDHLGYYPCRTTTPRTAKSSRAPAGNIMAPLHLTVRWRRRFLAAAVAAEGSGSAEAVSTAAATLAGLSGLLDAVVDLWFAGCALNGKLEMAWAASNRARRGDDTSGAETAELQQQRAVSAAAGAAADMVARGASPAEVDAVCSAMQTALGVRATEAPWAAPAAAADASAKQEAAATELLNPSRAYATAASAMLARLVSGDPDDRARALKSLRWVCASAAAESRSRWSQHGAGGAVAAAARGKAWGALAPMLGLFCREGDSSFRASGGGGNEVAPSVVLWARAEVLTLVRSFGGASVADEDPESTTTGSAGEAVGGVTTDNQQNESHGLVGDSDDGGRRLPSPLPTQLSVPFLRVAELAMEAFGKQTSPEDVDSWVSRSAFLGMLMAATTLGATFGSRENEGNGSSAAAREESIAALSREWWPKLISAAVDAREWEFVCRCLVSTGCAAFTSEAFEEALWSTLEASGAPPLVRIKVGLASLHPSRHVAATKLLASELSAMNNDSGATASVDDDILHLALSSPSLAQLAKTALYPSLAAVAMRCKLWSCPPPPLQQQQGQHRQPQQQQQQLSSSIADLPPPPTSSTEFLLLAMACAGDHGRAAALACETSGIHPGLRTLDGGLVVLGRRLRGGGGCVGAGGGDTGMGWFQPLVGFLRERAQQAFEKDVF
ncbi:unnamed protein product [Ectocarpus fasciculatus]